MPLKVLSQKELHRLYDEIFDPFNDIHNKNVMLNLILIQIYIKSLKKSEPNVNITQLPLQILLLVALVMENCQYYT